MDDTTPDHLLTELEEVDAAEAPAIADELANTLQTDLDDLEGDDSPAPPT